MASDSPDPIGTQGKKEIMDPCGETLAGAFDEQTSKVIDLHYGFPLAMGWAALSASLHNNEVGEFLRTLSDEDDDYVLPIQKVQEFRVLKRRSTATDAYFDRIPNLYIAALIEELDLFVGTMMRSLLCENENSKQLTDRTITYSDLLKFSSFDDAKTFLIEREVDRGLRNDILGQIEWLNGQGLKIDVKHHLILSAIELNERRNCIVHANGVANRFYLENCKTKGVNVKNIKVGESLKGSTEYYENAFNTVIGSFCLIFASVWVKLEKKNDKQWELLHTHISSVIYDLMIDAKWTAAKTILKFVENDLGLQFSDSSKKMNIVNLALCEFETGSKAKAVEFLDAVDWSSSGLEFRSSVAAIKGENDLAMNLFIKAYRSEAIDKQALVEWPVFNRLRKLKKFQKMFSDLVGPDDAGELIAASKRKVFIGPGMKKLVEEGMRQIEAYRSLSESSEPRPDKASG